VRAHGRVERKNRRYVYSEASREHAVSHLRRFSSSWTSRDASSPLVDVARASPPLVDVARASPPLVFSARQRFMKHARKVSHFLSSQGTNSDRLTGFAIEHPLEGDSHLTVNTGMSSRKFPGSRFQIHQVRWVFLDAGYAVFSPRLKRYRMRMWKFCSSFVGLSAKRSKPPFQKLLFFAEFRGSNRSNLASGFLQEKRS